MLFGPAGGPWGGGGGGGGTCGLFGVVGSRLLFAVGFKNKEK